MKFIRFEDTKRRAFEHFLSLGKSDHECHLFDANARTEYDRSNVPGFNIFKVHYTVIELNLDNVAWGMSSHVISNRHTKSSLVSWNSVCKVT